MRIHVLSDVHVERGEYKPPPIDADLVVLAGDIKTPSKGNPARMVRWAQEHYPRMPVVMVAGNHDFWRGGMERVRRKFAEAAAGTNVHVLERSSITVQGIRILGCTLWTDYALWGSADMGARAAFEHMNDFRYIRVGNGYRKARPSDFAAEHQRSIAWLEQELSTGEPSVVVTHHAPSARSVQPELLNDPVAPAYASNLDEFILRHKPLAWFHGHTHYPVDYHIGSTRIVSNPRGYPSDLCAGFQPELIVNI